MKEAKSADYRLCGRFEKCGCKHILILVMKPSDEGLKATVYTGLNNTYLVHQIRHQMLTEKAADRHARLISLCDHTEVCVCKRVPH